MLLTTIFKTFLCFSAVVLGQPVGSSSNDDDTCHHPQLSDMYAAMEADGGDILPELTDLMWTDDGVPDSWWGDASRTFTKLLASLLQKRIAYEQQLASMYGTQSQGDDGKRKRKRRSNASPIVATTVIGTCHNKNSDTGSFTGRICGECSAITTLSGGWSPAILNEVVCQEESCFSGEGLCRQRSMTIVLKWQNPSDPNDIEVQDYSIRMGCDAQLYKVSVLVPLNV